MREYINKQNMNFIRRGGAGALAVIIVGICAIVSRIMISSIYSYRGISIFSSSYGVYILGVLCFSYMLPIVIGLLMHPRIKQHQYKNALRMYKTCSLISFTLCLLLACGLFFYGDLVARCLFMDSFSKIPLMPLCLLLLFTCINGIFRGFFFGFGVSYPALISIVIEQVIGLISGILFMFRLDDYGKKISDLILSEDYTYVYGLVGFYLGLFVGAVFSLLFLLIIYFSTRSQYISLTRKNTGKGRETTGKVLYLFSFFYFPLMFLGICLRGNVLFAQMSFRRFLSESLSQDLVSMEWGLYYGIYRTYYIIPVILTIAMVWSLKTTISLYLKREAFQHLRDQIQSVLKANCLFVIPIIAFIAVCGNTLSAFSVAISDIEMAAELLLIGFFPALLFSFGIAFVFILFSFGEKRLASFCCAVSFVCYILLLYAMPKVFHLDIYGIVYADFITAFVFFISSGYFVKKKARIKSSILKSVIPCIIASAVMAGVLFMLNHALTSALPGSVLLALSIAVGIVVYYFLLALLRGATEKDLIGIPGGFLILGIYRLFHIV